LFALATLQAAFLLCVSSWNGLVATWRRLILGCTFRLHVLRNEPAVVTWTAFHQSLRFVHECVGQWIRADVAYRQLLALLFQNKFDAASGVANASRRHVASQTHTMRARGALQSLVFRNGVVVGLALAITEPG